MDESDTVRRTRPGQARPLVVIVLALALVVVGGGAWLARPHPPSDHFCDAVGHNARVDGHDVALQDQGDPGKDGCDLSDHFSGAASNPADDSANLVLGFDCKVRNRADQVVATTTPNRPDGTCGQPPDPDSHHAPG